MRRFFNDSFCVFIIISVVILCNLALAAGEDSGELRQRIDSIKKEIEESEKKLQKGEEKLKSIKKKKDKVIGSLDLYEDKIKKVNRNILTIKKEERNLQKILSETRAQFEKANQAMQERSDEYSGALRSIYKRHKVSPLELFFYSGSVSSFLRGFKLFSAIASEDMRIMKDLRTKQNTLQASMGKYEETRNAQISLARVKRSEEKQLTNTRKKQKTLLASLENDLQLQEEVNLRQRKELEKFFATLEGIQKEFKKRIETIAISPELEKYNFASRKGKLPWPVSGKVVSTFGMDYDEKTKTRTPNRGIEILTRHGEEVRSIASGKVAFMSTMRLYGNFIMIYHPTGYWTIYGHLSDILVAKDDEVAEGTIIASAGSTGMMSDNEARLLLEVLRGNNPENPLNWLKPDRRRVSN